MTARSFTAARLATITVAVGLVGSSISLLRADAADPKDDAQAKAEAKQAELREDEQRILKFVLPELKTLHLGMSKEELTKLRPKARPRLSRSGRPAASQDAKDVTLVEPIETMDAPSATKSERSDKDKKDSDDGSEAHSMLGMVTRHAGGISYIIVDDKCEAIAVERQLDSQSAAYEQRAIVQECINLFGDDYTYQVRIIKVPQIPEEIVYSFVTWTEGDDVISLRIDPPGTAQDRGARPPSIYLSLATKQAQDDLKLTSYDPAKHKAWFELFEKNLPEK